MGYPFYLCWNNMWPDYTCAQNDEWRGWPQSWGDLVWGSPARWTHSCLSVSGPFAPTLQQEPSLPWRTLEWRQKYKTLFKWINSKWLDLYSTFIQSTFLPSHLTTCPWQRATMQGAAPNTGSNLRFSVGRQGHFNNWTGASNPLIREQLTLQPESQLLLFFIPISIIYTIKRSCSWRLSLVCQNFNIGKIKPTNKNVLLIL